MNIRWKSKLAIRKNKFRRNSRSVLREMAISTALIFVIAASTYIMIVGYCYVTNLTYFQIKETVVRGCKEITEKEILSLAAISPFHSIININKEAISNRIASNPWIKKVYIGREFPNRLVIEVRERKAIALVKHTDGLHLLDTDGVIFKKLEGKDDVDFPVISGCSANGELNYALLDKSLELLKVLPNIKEDYLLNRISEIHANEIFGLTLFTDSGLSLQLGFDNYESKIKRLAPVMADIQRRGIKPAFMLIDLSDPTKITVQRKNVVAPNAPVSSKKGYRT